MSRKIVDIYRASQMLLVISGKYGRNETAGLLRPSFGLGKVSEVRSPLANPFETKRNFRAHWGCVGVCTGKVAEGEVLETNTLGGEKRSPWYDCANWRSGLFTQDCTPARRAETVSNSVIKLRNSPVLT